MIRYAVSALVLAAGAAAGAATPQDTRPSFAERQDAKLAQRLEGLTPGKSASCLPINRVTEVKVYNDTFLYIQGRNKVWVSKTNGGCGRGGDDILVSRLYNGQYCRGDIVETRARSGGFFTGACSLGEFTAYAK